MKQFSFLPDSAGVRLPSSFKHTTVQARLHHHSSHVAWFHDGLAIMTFQPALNDP